MNMMVVGNSSFLMLMALGPVKMEILRTRPLNNLLAAGHITRVLAGTRMISFDVLVFVTGLRLRIFFMSQGRLCKKRKNHSS